MKSFFRSYLLALPLTSLVSLLAFALFDFPLTGIDDANIYFVYARHLGDGFGFVFNAGGEKVEGFTSLLWTLMCAVVFDLSTRPELTLLVINIVLVSIGVAAALSLVQSELTPAGTKTDRRLLLTVSFLALLLTSPRYIIWNTITLMENSLWSSLLLLTTIHVVREQTSPRSINLGLIPLLALLTLTRPEANLWGVVFLGVLFLRLTATQGKGMAMKVLAPSILSFLLSMALLTLFRVQYFGYPAPNTFYAKVSPSLWYNIEQGLSYLFRYTISDPIVFATVMVTAIAAMDVVWRIVAMRMPAEGPRYLPVVAATGLLIPLLTGGDHFGSFRLYQSTYPIQLLTLVDFVGRFLLQSRYAHGQQRFSAWRPALLLAAGGVVVLGFQAYMWASIKPETAIEFSTADYGRKNGTFIHALFADRTQLPSLGVVTSGGIKYSYPGEVVDLMGLNNTLMAHNEGDRRGIKNHAAFDIPTFYRLEPDIVWPQTVIETDWQYSSKAIGSSWENTEGLKGLFNQPRFLQQYTYAKVSSQTQSGLALIGWFRQDLLEELAAHADLDVVTYEYGPEAQ